jgi:uncharacterized protein YjiS (DUF1127 family)
MVVMQKIALPSLKRAPNCASRRDTAQNEFNARTTEMTAIDTSRPLTNARIGNFMASAFSAVAAWNDARVTRKALSMLSNRELDDIGLCRGDIDDITR